MIALDPGPKFPTGEIIITQDATLKLPHEDVMDALRRHARGDWGEMDKEGREENEAALQKGMPLASIHQATNGIRFYIITEGDRSVTTVLLPEEF